MSLKLKNLFISGFVTILLSVVTLTSPTVNAAYDEGAYGSCAYNTGCEVATDIAPNTGLQYESLIWPVAAGVLGLSMASFVVIRFINRDKTSN